MRHIFGPRGEVTTILSNVRLLGSDEVYESTKLYKNESNTIMGQFDKCKGRTICYESQNWVPKAQHTKKFHRKSHTITITPIEI